MYHCFFATYPLYWRETPSSSCTTGWMNDVCFILGGIWPRGAKWRREFADLQWIAQKSALKSRCSFVLLFICFKSAGSWDHYWNTHTFTRTHTHVHMPMHTYTHASTDTQTHNNLWLRFINQNMSFFKSQVIVPELSCVWKQKNFSVYVWYVCILVGTVLQECSFRLVFCWKENTVHVCKWWFELLSFQVVKCLYLWLLR